MTPITMWMGSPAETHRAGVLLRDGIRCVFEKRIFEDDELADRIGLCRGDVAAHHIIPKQRIKRQFSGWVRDNAISDPRNGCFLCEKHHALNTGDLTKADVPDLAGLKAFAQQYGFEGSLLADLGVNVKRLDEI